MWQNILIWVIVAAVGLICLRWVYKTLTNQKGGGCGCGSATCPLRNGGDAQSFSPHENQND
jgi:hypothetical protein